MRESSRTSTFAIALAVLLVLGLTLSTAAIAVIFVGIRVVIPATTVAASGAVQAMLALPVAAWTQSIEVLNSGTSEERRVILVEFDKAIREMPSEQLQPELVDVLTTALTNSAEDPDEEVSRLAQDLIAYMATANEQSSTTAPSTSSNPDESSRTESNENADIDSKNVGAESKQDRYSPTAATPLDPLSPGKTPED